VTSAEEAERLLGACRVCGENNVERELLHKEIADVHLFRSGTSETYEVEFSDGTHAAFKSIEGAENSAPGYNHTGASVLASDYAAWLVARGLGYEHLVGGVVLTVCSHVGAGLGSLQVWLEGDPSGSGWETSGRVREAALFDALIAQQDRNGTNFNYDSPNDEIGRFDNSFAFAIPGHNMSQSAILAQAHSDSPALEQDLLDALERFEASPEQTALEAVLEPARYARLRERAAEMRQTGELLTPLTA
jgi:hypothetical protein